MPCSVTQKCCPDPWVKINVGRCPVATCKWWQLQIFVFERVWRRRRRLLRCERHSASKRNTRPLVVYSICTTPVTVAVTADMVVGCISILCTASSQAEWNTVHSLIYLFLFFFILIILCFCNYLYVAYQSSSNQVINLDYLGSLDPI